MAAILEVVLEQRFAGQQCINRFNYHATGEPAVVSYSFALMEAMGWVNAGAAFVTGSVAEAIQLLQDTDVQYIQCTVRNVHSFTDFYQVPFLNDKFGNFAGVSLSPTTAYGFRTNRTRLDIRRGMKRFTGVAKEALTHAGELTGSGVTRAEAVADKLSEVLSYNDEGNIITLAPIVCQKEEYDVPGSDPVRKAYKYYSTYAAQIEHSMTGVLWENYTNTRTQGSRQIGKGR